VPRLVAPALALLLLALPATGTLPAEGGQSRAVKAAFLLNFLKLVDWPESSFADPGSPMVIGVLGRDPFDQLLDETLRGRTAHGRALRVLRFPVANGALPPPEQLRSCHLLFVSDSERDRLPQILERLGDASVLTVSDLERFADAGGIVEFILVGANIHFRFNRQAAEAAGLHPTSRLLKAARRVGPAD